MPCKECYYEHCNGRNHLTNKIDFNDSNISVSNERKKLKTVITDHGWDQSVDWGIIRSVPLKGKT